MATAPAPASPSPSQFQSQSRPQFKRGTIARRSAPKSSVPATSSGEAQSFFINLLGLPNSAAFSPELSLQILTHKSYRYAHRVSDTLSSTSAEREQSQASHNSRLAFIGRRALAAYSAMFVHSVLGHTSSADQAEFRRNRDMESRLDALRDPLNIGQHVGSAWGLESVMRWDKIPVSALLICANDVERGGERLCQSQSPGSGSDPRRRIHPIRITGRAENVSYPHPTPAGQTAPRRASDRCRAGCAR